MSRPRSRRSTAKFHTIDCETDPFKHGRVPQPFLWGVYSGHSETYESFTDRGRLVEYLSTLGGTVYAHNGGKFDFHYLRDDINSDESISIINGRLARFRIGRTEFRDSLNIFPNTRLADFDDAYGKKIEIDYIKLEPDARLEPNNWAEIGRYLRNDCVRLWEIVKKYWDEYGKSLTQAGSAMKYFERMYGIEAPRQTQTQYNRYKPFYYGGRVQCFAQGIGRTHFRVADINSAYPFAMLRDHPFSPSAVLQKHLPPEPKLYRCLIKLDCTSRGAFPWRAADGELYFPEDDRKTRTYTVTGWEFLTALELDAISNVHIREVHYFTQTMNFRNYIEHFYAKREECRKRGDVAGRIFGKYFMNSLYGKFGANCERYREYVIATDESVERWTLQGYQVYKPWGLRWLLTRAPLEEQLNDLTSKKWRYYNVATAASVTGFVRAYLFRAIQNCSGVLYCDTDSIAARSTANLDYGDALGKWKAEADCDHYAIAGKKLYAFHLCGKSEQFNPEAPEKERTWKVASKGIALQKEKEAPSIIARIAQGEKYAHAPEVPTYSIIRNTPTFINRLIVRTAKNIALAPEVDL